MTCQRNWLYLESIFGAPDIQRQLPDEAKMFNQVDKSWKEIMRRVQKNPLAIRSGTTPGKIMYSEEFLWPKNFTNSSKKILFLGFDIHNFLPFGQNCIELIFVDFIL